MRHLGLLGALAVGGGLVYGCTLDQSGLLPAESTTATGTATSTGTGTDTGTGTVTGTSTGTVTGTGTATVTGTETGTATGAGGSGGAGLTGGSGGGPTGGSGGTGLVGGGGGGLTGGSGGGGPVCGTDQCVPDPQPGTPVVELSSGSCPGSDWTTETLLYEGDDPGCEACSCGTPTATCTGARVVRYSDASCANYKDHYDLGEGDCQNVNESSSSQAQSYAVITSYIDTTGCPESDSNPLPLKWLSVCRLETAVSQTCHAGSGVCVPPPSGTVGRICTLLAGDVSCPAGYPNRRLVYGTFSDSRSCACGCGSIDNDYCSGIVYTLYNDSSCGGYLGEASGYGCRDASAFTGHDSFRLTDAGDYVAGTCQPQDLHTGGVSFGTPQTLCCPSP